MIPALSPFGFSTPPYAFVNFAYFYGGAGAVASLALPATSLTTGNHIFAHIRYESATTTVTVTDTAGNTYTGLTQTTATGLVVGRWFYCLNATGNAANIVTFSFAANRSFTWGSALQFSRSTATFDTETSGSATAATTVTSSSFSTAAAGLLLAGRGVFNQQTATSFNNSIAHMAVTPPTDTVLNYGSVGYVLTTSPQSGITVTETGNSATNRCLQIASFV